MIPDLETQRLWLRPLTLRDADQIQERFPDWDVVRLMSGAIPWPYPPDGALKWCGNVALPQMARGDAWYWTMRLKDEPEQVIGVISLMNTEGNNRGFWVGLQWQRRGLATEAAEAVTDFWFDVLKFPVLRVPKAVANVASRRISQKQNMRVVATEERDHVSGRALDEIWEITADEWHARPRPGRTRAGTSRFPDLPTSGNQARTLRRPTGIARHSSRRT
jgi:ribosomal-protein-alanine N-acetyltransferase